MIFQLMKCEIGANTNKFVLIFVALNVKASCGSEVWFLVIFWVAFLQQHSIISGLVGRLGVIRETMNAPEALWLQKNLYGTESKSLEFHPHKTPKKQHFGEC